MCVRMSLVTLGNCDPHYRCITDAITSGWEPIVLPAIPSRYRHPGEKQRKCMKQFFVRAFFKKKKQLRIFLSIFGRAKTTKLQTFPRVFFPRAFNFLNFLNFLIFLIFSRQNFPILDRNEIIQSASKKSDHSRRRPNRKRFRFRLNRKKRPNQHQLRNQRQLR